MKNKMLGIGLILTMLFLLSGCSSVGSKTATLSVIYLATTLLAVTLLIGYLFLIKTKEPWFILLFSAVTVVNLGYLSLSISSTLNEALLSNRISYLGSVLLPASMLMAILKTCEIKTNKWFVTGLLGISAIVFAIAASPGYLDIYYKEVYLTTVGGSTVLEKVYGPLHSIYLYYLLGHFSAMIGITIYACAKKKVKSGIQAFLLISSVFVNIGVWFMEQLVDIDFEILSVSYIASEIFLLGFSLLIQDFKCNLSPSISHEYNTAISNSNQNTDTEKNIQEKAEYLNSMLYTLTPSESEIFKLYLKGKQTKEILEILCITENTLKYHNKNIYSKLGVINRKELIKVAKFTEESPANT